MTIFGLYMLAETASLNGLGPVIETGIVRGPHHHEALLIRKQATLCSLMGGEMLQRTSVEAKTI